MMSTILPNANNSQITGGQFSIVNNYQRTGPRLSGIDLLREYCAIGALLDSSERFDPPRCAAETREAIIKMILDWINGSGESASMAWLFGGAGAGKSALAQTIAEILQREGRLAGSFFFSRTATVERSDGHRLIPTLVYQLLEAFPGLKPHVEESINKHTGLFDRLPGTQMDLLLLKPLTVFKERASPMPLPSSSLSKSKSRRRNFVAKVFQGFMKTERLVVQHKILQASPRPRPNSTNAATEPEWSQPQLIVIDGLDECNSQEVQMELLRVMASAIPRLPFPLRILITSRPEGSITRTFDYDESFQSLNVHRISLGDDENADSDIRKFLIKGFQEIHRTHSLRAFLSPSWPPNNAITTLVQKSSSHFIYASTAMKYIQYLRGKPDSRLEVILGLSVPPTTDKPFAQLDALYTHIFMSMDEPDRTTINHVFGIVHLAGRNNSLYMQNSATPLKLEQYLGMQEGEIHLLLEPLLSLVVLSSRESDIKILHASLFDFLLDVSRSGDLHLDLKMAHGLIARHELKKMMSYTLGEPLGQLDIFIRADWVFQQLDLDHEDGVVMDNCWAFLKECRDAYLLEDIRDYLVTFPYLYDIILHPDTAKYLAEKFHRCIPFILQLFLPLFLKKDFDNGQRLHDFHTTQILQRLQSIHAGIGDNPFLPNGYAQEVVFNNVLYQDLHRVHKAFLNVDLGIDSKQRPIDILNGGSGYMTPKDASEDLQAHTLIIFLPHLTHNETNNCTKWAELTGHSHLGDNELHQVLLRRVMEYVQRVGLDADPSELSKCKKAWGITE